MWGRVRGAAVAQAALALPHQDCDRQTFTEQLAQVPAGMRTTTRPRTALAVAVQDGRDQSEVAAAHRVSWPTVQRAVVAHGAVELAEPEPEPTRVLGLDETRFGRPRWRPDGHHDDGRMRWQRTDPWETGFVDITGDQALLGQIDGRTSAAVAAWLASRTEEFRACGSQNSAHGTDQALHRRGIPPAPSRSTDTSWRQFLRTQAARCWPWTSFTSTVR